jgi:hypothetical protein
MPLKASNYGRNFPLIAGITLPDQPIQLDSQHTPITGVVIDNANSTISVIVWSGKSPNLGNPYIILPGWCRAFSIFGTSAIYVQFQGIPSTSGSIYIFASNTELVAFSTSTNVYSPGFPLNATPLRNTGFQQLQISAPAQTNVPILNIPFSSAANFYLKYIRTWGFKTQPFNPWALFFAPTGIASIRYITRMMFGDISLDYDLPVIVPIPPITGPPPVNIATVGIALEGVTELGTLNFTWEIGGFVI